MSAPAESHGEVLTLIPQPTGPERERISFSCHVNVRHRLGGLRGPLDDGAWAYGRAECSVPSQSYFW